MFLKSLEIRGFKSFADKTELKFKKGVTAVVGPNGSGKSNVSDSVRWVLGEQSVKNLRGGKMEDVIFAGTQFRKALGLAQVSLTLDNTDGRLSTDYNEVTVTRRIFRSGETEYLINNQKCRLKDITELFMDTGIGKEGYSLIGQGKIDAILSGKPEERRALFEEAAGIVKYKARKEEAEKKLDNTDNNLIRIRDIISTYEERLEPLRLEKEKAIKYKELAQDLKVKEVSVIVSQIEKVEAEIKDVSSEVNRREEEIQRKRENLILNKEILSKLEMEIESLEKKNRDEKDEYYLKKQQVSQNNSDIELFKERTLNFKSLIEKEEKEIQELINKVSILNSEKEELEKNLSNKINEKRENDLKIVEIENEIDSIDKTINNIENELNSLKGNEFKILSKNAEINNIINSLIKDLNSKNEEQKLLEVNIARLKSNLTINVGTIEELKVKVSDTKAIISSLEENIVVLRKKLSESKSKLNNQDNKIKIISKRINEAEATHLTLSNLEKHYEGYNRTVKNLMDHVDKGFVQNISPIKVLGEIFNVAKEYEVAVEIALGGAISNVITNSDEDAKKLINYLKIKGLGRATFLPLNIIKGKRLEVPKNIKEINGYIGIASDILNYDEKYKSIIDYNLGRTVVAKDMDCALKISKVANHNYKIVTLSGEVINPGGALTGGSIQGKNNNLLGRKREIEELALNIEKLKEQFKAESTIFENIKSDIKSIDEEILNKREDIHQKNIDLTVLDGEIKALINEGEKLKISIKESNNSIEKNEEQIVLYNEKLAERKEELLSLDQRSSESKDKVKALEENLFNYKNSLDAKKESHTNIKIVIATMDENLQNTKQQVNAKNFEIKEKDDKIKFLQKEVESKKENIEILEKQINEKTKEIKLLESRILDLENIFKDDEVKKVTIKEKYKVQETTISEILNAIRIDESDLNKIAISNARIESELESLYNKLNGELNLTLVEAKDLAIVIKDINKVKEEIYALKRKISNLGVVNLAAIVEYDEILEKYEFMSTQELDLQKAKEELLGVISEMTDKMQELFKENFKTLNENFGETFKELFKGGTGELILADDDVLSSNIIINVQPPGKKLQNINLMSGGEKVLSAIALLFAILKMKPTPFCILDEIEAALDDANVYRYAEFLKAFSDNIQFIVITHRKGTMEASDIMYGVTMEEKGVSKVVSVDLTNN